MIFPSRMNKLVIELSGYLRRWIGGKRRERECREIQNPFEVVPSYSSFEFRGVEEVAYSQTGIERREGEEGVSLQGDNVANLYSKGDRAKLLNVHSWPRLLCPSHSRATPIIPPPWKPPLPLARPLFPLLVPAPPSNHHPLPRLFHLLWTSHDGSQVLEQSSVNHPDSPSIFHTAQPRNRIHR